MFKSRSMSRKSEQKEEKKPYVLKERFITSLYSFKIIVKMIMIILVIMIVMAFSDTVLLSIRNPVQV